MAKNFTDAAWLRELQRREQNKQPYEGRHRADDRDQSPEEVSK